MYTARLSALFILLASTMFFVASEFAIVKVRATRINQLIEEGNKKAIKAKRVITHLDEYLSATQLGITITSLGIGWLGEPTVKAIIEPLFIKLHIPESAATLISFVIAFSLITFLHVVVGELAPKTVAIQKAETITVNFAGPLIMFYRITFPIIWALNHSARFITGLIGIKPSSEGDIAHSEEELRMILSDSYQKGEINQSEYRYVNNIFEFDERLAREIMVPRTEIDVFQKEDTLEDILDQLYKQQHTRFPVADGDKDSIIGLINTKELMTACLKSGMKLDMPIEPLIKPIITVIESIPIHDLLIKMQKEQTHMAVLIDEYGGTSGLVTVEDILEEIVGDIRDEFDDDELPEIRKLGDNHYIVDSKLLLSEINDLLGTHIDNPDVDTIGGWYLTRKMDVIVGDSIEEEGYIFTISEAEEYHILYIEIKKAT
ncbi:hemolysin family protein [Pradoshia sp.]